MDTGNPNHLDPADLIGNNLVERRNLSDIETLLGSMIALTGIPKHLDLADQIVP